MYLCIATVVALLPLFTLNHASPVAQSSQSSPRSADLDLHYYRFHIRCPRFTSHFTTISTIPPKFAIALDAEPLLEPHPELKTRQDVSLRVLVSSHEGRTLALASKQILQIALQAGHVLVVVVTATTKELILATNNIGEAIMTARPLDYQTDHILPVSMPYLFMRHLATTAYTGILAQLQVVMPINGVATQFTNHLRDGFYNSECNLMLVPGFINQVMGTLIASPGLPNPARFDNEAAELIRQYTFKISGFYQQAAIYIGSQMAKAISDPLVEKLFIDFCEAQFAKAVHFVRPESVWTGPHLQTIQLGTDGNRIP